ncbi:MAG: SDR family oxidoreductase [Acidobacteriota bacterium]|nr:SDR family oxidoreductase [Acidobacteriota bacterium]
MKTSLQGRHAVVTGGSRGLGAAIARVLAAAGADVTIMGRTPAKLQLQVESIQGPGRAQAVRCDVSDAASVARAFAEAHAAFGPVGILVNNAGEASAGPFQQVALEDWQRLIGINLTGPFLCIQQVLPGMISASLGTIVNIASSAGVRGYGKAASYCASKHGVVGLTRALGAELARDGITVNALCPGYIDGTDMFHSAVDNVMKLTGKPLEDARAALAKGSPGGRLTSPDEVADAVVWLCSPVASQITGQAIAVPGREKL